MPYFPMNTEAFVVSCQHPSADHDNETSSDPPIHPPASIQVKNRRKRYLELHPEYFSSGLELADPLLYDRLIRRFQTASEREEEGRAKGYSGELEADLMRAELKMEALAHPDPNTTFTYARGPHGEILAEEEDEIPATREEGKERWRSEMELRFLRGADQDFDYATVDECDDYDDQSEEQEKYFDEEEPEWLVETDENGNPRLQGETGVQDF
ncbi:hypothetical protein D8B26_006010 [Coccidioides posadasii str. Silveira]|uniref:CCD97-like C-terminal domain-containing protein n=2 Tax=Coccidioides posadasii TaxID=199306 RepID=E9DC08_COCPS|nr:conserved hypothetical protein [Coccidioides posadasii str. Silveira]KMM67826.1 hypothetical protein CPAG_04159 [Coccidioides posadasii RMSCC 3488]QVM11359.1 hypothetical protein D8B26_006010 [Coccidioides posadasii str. Silveira]